MVPSGCGDEGFPTLDVDLVDDRDIRSDAATPSDTAADSDAGPVDGTPDAETDGLDSETDGLDSETDGGVADAEDTLGADADGAGPDTAPDTIADDTSLSPACAQDVSVRTLDDLAAIAAKPCIDGDLHIWLDEGEAVVELPQLVEIRGSLMVVGDATQAAHGAISLPALRTIGLNLETANTDADVSITAPILTRIGGHVDLTLGTVRVDLPELKTINGDLRVHDAAIAQLNLDALSAVGGALRLFRYSVESDTAQDPWPLELPSLASIDGDFELHEGAATRVVAPKLLRVGRDVDLFAVALELELPLLSEIGGNLRMTELVLDAIGLDGLERVGASLLIDTITFSAATTLELTVLAQVGRGLDLLQLGGIDTINLPGLDRVGARMRVQNNDELVALTATQLSEVGGELRVNFNGSLLLTAPALEVVGGTLSLRQNTELIAGLSNLGAVGGDLELGDSPLTVLAPKLASVAGDVRIFGLWDTVAIELPKLLSVAGDLIVSFNIDLATVRFPVLQQIGTLSATGTGGLDVRHNVHLQSLGLNSLSSVADSVQVENNPLLATDAIEGELDDVIVGGSTVICGNMDGESCD